MVKERRTELVEDSAILFPISTPSGKKRLSSCLAAKPLGMKTFPASSMTLACCTASASAWWWCMGARPQIDANPRSPSRADLSYPETYPALRMPKPLRAGEEQAAGLLQLDITARLSMSLNNTPLRGRISTSSAVTSSSPSLLAWTMAWITATADAFVVLIRSHSSSAGQRRHCADGPVAVYPATGESFNLTSEEIATQLAIKLKGGENDWVLLLSGRRERRGDRAGTLPE